MDDTTSANGDIASASAESVAAPVTPTTAVPSDSGGAPPTTGTQDQPGSLTPDATAPGPIPYQRFEEVNRRMKDAEDRYRQTEQSWGEILKADPQQIRNMLGWYQRAAQDPVAHATQLLAELQADPRYQGQVASQAARILGSLRQSQPKADPEPQPDLVAENGTPVMSAPRQREWAAWNQRQMQGEFDAKLQQAIAPFKGMAQREQQREVSQRAEASAAQMYQRAQTWHGFKEHEAEIAKSFDANPSWSLQDAYLHVLHTKILPSMPAKAQAQVVADLQSKAAAQTLNPTNTSKAAAPDFKGDFKAALEYHAGKR
jgi:hypothetical protein